MNTREFDLLPESVGNYGEDYLGGVDYASSVNSVNSVKYTYSRDYIDGAEPSGVSSDIFTTTGESTFYRNPENYHIGDPTFPTPYSPSPAPSTWTPYLDDSREALRERLNRSQGNQQTDKLQKEIKQLREEMEEIKRTMNHFKKGIFIIDESI